MKYKQLYQELKRKIRKDYGLPCKDFDFHCHVCEVYMMLDILEGVADLEDWDKADYL